MSTVSIGFARVPRVYWLYLALTAAVLIPSFMIVKLSFTPISAGSAVLCFCAAVLVGIKFKHDFRARGPVPFVNWFCTERTTTPVGVATMVALGYVAGLSNTLRDEAVATAPIRFLTYGLTGVVAVGLLLFGWRVWTRWVNHYRRMHDGQTPFSTTRSKVVRVFVWLCWAIVTFGLSTQVYRGAEANPMSTIYSGVLFTIGLILVRYFWNISQIYLGRFTNDIEHSLDELARHIGREPEATRRERRAAEREQVDPPETEHVPPNTAEAPWEMAATPQQAPPSLSVPTTAMEGTIREETDHEPASAWEAATDDDWDGLFTGTTSEATEVNYGTEPGAATPPRWQVQYALDDEGHPIPRTDGRGFLIVGQAEPGPLDDVPLQAGTERVVIPDTTRLA